MIEKLKKIYTLLFAIFCFTIPFSQFGEAIPNIALIPLVGLFPFVMDLKEIKKSFDKSAFVFLMILALILLEIVIFSRGEDLNLLIRLLYIPLVYLLSAPINNKNIALSGFLAGAATLMVFSYFRIITYIFQSEGFDFSVGRFINEILLGERPYVGFVYVLGVLLSIYFIVITKSKRLRVILVCATILFLILILIISARLSMLTLFILGFISLFYTKKWKISFLFLTGFVFVVFLFFILNPNFIDRFYAGFQQEDYTIEKALIMEPRYHIWDCATDIIKNENTFWKGLGFQNSEKHLVDCYKTHDYFKNDEHRQYFIDSRFNTHNQFLGLHLGAGFFAAVLLSLFFVLASLKSRHHYFALSVLMALLLFCLVENVLVRQMGCLLFGFAWVISGFFQKSTSELNRSSE